MNRLDLQGQWTLTGVNRSVSTQMTVPGDNIAALLQAGLIDDPYYGKNELLLREIGTEEWRLSRTFTVDETLLKNENIYLELNFVDTFTTITINDKMAGCTENSFRRYRFSVKPLLNQGENRITILFHSAQHEAEKRAKSLPFPVPYSGGNNNQIPYMNTIRKVQCHAGWDWGLTLMVSGIYDTVALEGTGSARLEYLTHKQHHREGAVEVELSARLFVSTPGNVELTFTLGKDSKVVKTPLPKGDSCVKTTFQIENPQLWWPVGYGEQPLYQAAVSTKEGHSIQQKIGLRTLKVVNQKDDAGTSFLFQINGVDIFCKGANWIPTDALPYRQNGEKERSLLQEAVAANMNMIRVWGGGQYERDSFYNSCDELGLLVWQDAMFACSLYPSETWFLNEVKEEITHQVLRLSHHPSLALWCGDNEIVGALNWYPESKENYQRYLVNYDRLNRTIQECVERLDPCRKFWPSSPCNGEMSYGDGWHDDSSGDMHYWQVWHSGDDFESYYSVHPRFCSEFGFQSFPEMATVASYAPPHEWNITSVVMEHHQKNSRGNSLITEMMTRYFRMPESFEGYLYLSQLQQALAIKMGVEYWRSQRPVCMGTLYWQLNDNWPVASWSSIDYYGRRKQLHYHARRFYAPVIIAARLDKGVISLCVVNDRRSSFSGTLTAELISYEGMVERSEEHSVAAEPGSVRPILEEPLKKWTDDCENYFIELTLKEGEQPVATNTLFLSKFKALSLPQPGVTIEVEPTSKREFQVTLRTKKPALFVMVLSKKGVIKLSDNSLTLLPERAVSLKGEIVGGLERGELAESLYTIDLSSK